jgi:hypothetical protein
VVTASRSPVRAPSSAEPSCTMPAISAAAVFPEPGSALVLALTALVKVAAACLRAPIFNHVCYCGGHMTSLHQDRQGRPASITAGGCVCVQLS